MLRILFLSHRVPFPPDRGDRIRSYHFLRHLAHRHCVSLAAVADERPDPQHLRDLDALCATVDIELIGRKRRLLATTATLATTVPLTIPMFWSSALKSKIERRLAAEHFDVIFIYCSAMAPYVLPYPTPPKVIDFIDADSQKWFDYARRTRSPMKAVYWREGLLLRRFERRIARSCEQAFVASEADARILRGIVGKTPLATLPNGVSITVTERPMRTGRRLIFSGVMDYMPNVDAMTYFVRDIFPLVRARVPDAELVIVGQKPTPTVQRLAHQPGVAVTGWVRDTLPYLHSADVFVAPLRIARGIPNKILEAMAAGLPVVCTSSGLTGISAEPNQDLLVADTPERFAALTVSLLLDAGHRDAVRSAGMRYVDREHRWEVHLNRMETMLLDIVRRTSSDGVAVNG